MFLQKEVVHTRNDKYLALTNHVIRAKNQISSSAAATLIIHNDTIVNESYFGSYEYNSKIQSVKPSTRFNVASVRKSYIGFAISLALYQNPMQQIEAGGPPKKVDLQSLPVPIRYIGYCIVFGIPLLFLTLIIISFLK